ncbi:MAG: hypothetical protein HN982_10735 [Candidatus Marinimicrobia bacterium]|jgi:hypothetical protein|nr:hypothetical protein [Candidatus Neomarinimicrobiota bacterium]
MKNTLKSGLFIFMSILLLGLVACEDEEVVTELTTAEKIVGVWLADASTGDLGNATAGSGSLAGAAWTSYELTLNSDNTFSATGLNGYDIAPYGDGDGTINYSGTYTIDDTQDPMWIDLTCTASDNIFFTTAESNQPAQPGSFVLNSDASELTIQYGSTEYAVPRPDPISVPSILVKQ